MSEKKEELNLKIKNLAKDLSEITDMARKSAEVQQYMEHAARFHQYSMRNIMLILMQKPEATRVASFSAWKEMGRWPHKGTGIGIFAPMHYKAKNTNGDDEWRLGGFKIVHVHDVSDTEGKPLPEMPEWRSLARDETVEQILYQFAEQHNIIVEVKEFNNNAQGASFGGRIQLAPGAGTKTLIHELAHELLHHSAGFVRGNVMECQAEGVAYTVAKYFDFPDLRCPTYLALHDLEGKQLLDHMDTICRTSKQMIEFIEEQLLQTVTA